MKKIKFISLLSSLLLLTSCNQEMIKDRITTTISEMLPNLWLTLVQLALFILVAILFIFLLYKPFKKKINERNNKIENDIKEAERKNQEAEENLKKSQEYISSSEKRAGEIIQNAQKTSDIKLQTLEEELSHELQEKRDLAYKEIQFEKEKALKEANEEIINSAILASKEILKREVNEEDNKKMIEEFLKELNKTQDEK